MVRLGAVLCGTVMYGLVRLARFVSLWFVAVCNGKEWLARQVTVRRSKAWLCMAGKAGSVLDWRGAAGSGLVCYGRL